jgi:outer membrane protein
MKILNLLIVFLLMGGISQAADLAELKDQALENREIVQRYIANLEKSASNKSLALSSLYPSVDLSYMANWLDEANLYSFEAKENSVASGRVTLNVFAGFRDRYNIKSAELLRSADAHKLQGVRQDIKLAVGLRYLAIFSRQASLQVVDDSYNTLLKLHEDAVNRFEVGLIKKSEMLRFKVDLDNAVIARDKAKVDLEKSGALLSREVGREVDYHHLAFEEFTEIPVLPGEPASYVEKMLNKRSEIKFLEEIAAAAAMKVRIEQALYYPRVDVAGIYSKYDDDIVIGNGIRPEEEVRAQVVLSMNLFDGFGKGARIDSARFEARGMGYDLAEARRDFTTQLQNLFLDFKVSSDVVVVAEGSISQAEENLRVTRLAYEEGVSPESDLLDSITSLSRAKYNYVVAKSEVFANYIRIIRAVEGL